MTDFFNTTGHLFQKFFKIMPAIGNSYNVLMIIGGFVALFIWLYMQGQYNKKAESEGTIK